MKRTRQFSTPVAEKACEFPGRVGGVLRRARVSVCPAQNGTPCFRIPFAPGTERPAFKTRVAVLVWQISSFEVPVGQSR